MLTLFQGRWKSFSSANSSSVAYPLRPPPLMTTSTSAAGTGLTGLTGASSSMLERVASWARDLDGRNTKGRGLIKTKTTLV